MKARPVDYTRGFRDGQKDGIRKAIKALGASIDIAMMDVLGVTPERVKAVEEKANRMIANALDGYVSLDDIIEARQDEVVEQIQEST